MLPGKKYRPEDFLEIVWRRKWVAIVPFVIITIGTVIGTQFLPNRYRSDARVLIVPQQVPENYVEPTVTANLQARLQAISQEIQSRTRLERIIQELNLYPRQRRTMIMEDVVEMMRTDISVQIARARRRQDPGSFTVSFESDNARMAMQVTERLASLFITENLQDRTVQADQTSQFLETQLEEARRRLADHEQKLAQFRLKHQGELPSQVQSNLGVMQSTQGQLESLANTINRDRDRQLVLEKTMADLVAINTAAAQAAQNSRKAGAQAAAATATQQLEEARNSLRGLELRLKPEHPDVIRARRAVRELEGKAQAEELTKPVGVGVGADSRPAMSAADQKRLSEMQAESESLERRIAANRAEETRLQALVSQYRAKVEAAPTRESEETELMRDYNTLRAQYEVLLKRSQQSNIAADLERRQIGEQFRLIDAARLPERPISPDRPRLNMMGALGGLALGLALIALLEYRNTSFRTDDDVALSLSLPVLAVIPTMSTRRERQHARHRRLVTYSASLVATIGAIAAIVWMIDDIARWVR